MSIEIPSNYNNLVNSYKFTPGSIEHPAMPPGGRGLELYEKELLFNRHELNGKTVLDLGAGLEIKFARELKVSGIKADVISLSPDFGNPKYFDKIKELSLNEKVVIGFAQELPFEENMFDAIFCCHVIPYLLLPEDHFMMIKEIARVLKRGGFARIGPIIPPSLESIGYCNELIFEWDINKTLKKYKVEISEIIDQSRLFYVKDRFGHHEPRHPYVVQLKKKPTLKDRIFNSQRCSLLP